ncbi:MAG: hypothetical protein N3E50_08010, partial [Candidatus Goldbacteria bacterium]|nr:hypothetical protein [Candidatus Goldiibacteriota bacterium]
DLIISVRVLGVIFFFITFFYLIKNAIEEQNNKYIAISTALGFMATSGIIAVWFFGGLEQPLVCALLSASIYYILSMIREKNFDIKKSLKAGILLGLLAITRPDGILFTISITIGILFIKKINKETFFSAFVIFLPSIILITAQTIFRIFYYNDILPNSAYLKLGLSQKYIQYGLHYLKQGIESMLLIMFILILCIITQYFNNTNRSKFTFLIIPLLVWIIYIITIGGDIFPAYRHLAPVIVIMSYMIFYGMSDIEKIFSLNNKLKILLTITIIILLSINFINQFKDKMIKLAKYERWEWLGKTIGLMLKKAFFDKQPLMAISAAGCLPYWSDLPVIDTLGLNDYYIPRYSKKDPKERRIAHELGDGAYILSRNPDLIIFYGPFGSMGPMYSSEVQMFDMEEFKEKYIPCFIRPEKNSNDYSIIWFRLDSLKTGLKVYQNKIFLPAYFLSYGGHTYSYFDDTEKIFKAILKNNRPCGIIGLKLNPGKYILETEPKINCSVFIYDNLSKKEIKYGKLPVDFNFYGGKIDIKITSEENSELKGIYLKSNN